MTSSCATRHMAGGRRYKKTKCRSRRSRNSRISRRRVRYRGGDGDTITGSSENNITNPSRFQTWGKNAYNMLKEGRKSLKRVRKSFMDNYTPEIKFTQRMTPLYEAYQGLGNRTGQADFMSRSAVIKERDDALQDLRNSIDGMKNKENYSSYQQIINLFYNIKQERVYQDYIPKKLLNELLEKMNDMIPIEDPVKRKINKLNDALNYRDSNKGQRERLLQPAIWGAKQFAKGVADASMLTGAAVGATVASPIAAGYYAGDYAGKGLYNGAQYLRGKLPTANFNNFMLMGDNDERTKKQECLEELIQNCMNKKSENDTFNPILHTTSLSGTPEKGHDITNTVGGKRKGSKKSNRRKNIRH
jgi:hypothetical protein